MDAHPEAGVRRSREAITERTIQRHLSRLAAIGYLILHLDLWLRAIPAIEAVDQWRTHGIVLEIIGERYGTGFAPQQAAEAHSEDQAEA
jgi:abortive infection bacteriophage resistance protein